ncbi:uncharacterized protein I206_105533 [Kwoniella pini CBS 10737]|uniref:Uncharacterized protein n=1 Tax=Kwoniella pini CBS 10737 TaxID=1296096 RepID=A0A1B9I402_9TREE|nr:uncharacterized protein I206_03565 [Kwoniella pini CBS 10737]OCF50246.1 hypothetical protein I206_03565 [Kwoniella pini CBS 10737]
MCTVYHWDFSGTLDWAIDKFEKEGQFPNAWSPKGENYDKYNILNYSNRLNESSTLEIVDSVIFDICDENVLRSSMDGIPTVAIEILKEAGVISIEDLRPIVPMCTIAGLTDIAEMIKRREELRFVLWVLRLR